MEQPKLFVSAEVHLQLIKLVLMKDQVAEVFTPDEAQDMLEQMLAKQVELCKTASNYVDQYGTYGDYEIVDMSYTHGRLFACVNGAEGIDFHEEAEIVIG